MARKRASMREGPLAELFRATEAAQRQAEQARQAPEEPCRGRRPSIHRRAAEPEVAPEPVRDAAARRRADPQPGLRRARPGRRSRAHGPRRRRCDAAPAEPPPRLDRAPRADSPPTSRSSASSASAAPASTRSTG